MSSDQKNVLEWLKKQNRLYPVFNIGELHQGTSSEKVYAAYNRLSHEEEFEILKEFAEWGLNAEKETKL